MIGVLVVAVSIYSVRDDLVDEKLVESVLFGVFAVIRMILMVVFLIFL